MYVYVFWWRTFAANFVSILAAVLEYMAVGVTVAGWWFT